MVKVDRDKTKKLNALVLNGLNEIKEVRNGENKLKELMSNDFGILSGEIRKALLSHSVEDMKLSIKYMLLNSIFDITKDESYKLDIFYNSKLKLRFLNRYPSNTQIPYARIFEKSKEYEVDYKKDLNAFSQSEIENVLHSLEPLTESASHVNGRIVTAYIDYCIENEQTKTITNPLRNESPSYFERFVDKTLQLYYTKRDIEKLVMDCNNSQDAIIVKLLFLGIEGKSLSEIRNIKKEHVNDAINKNNVITVFNENNKSRQVQLDESTISLLVDAMNINEYYKKNGAIEDESVGLITNLVENDYVLRTSITKTDIKNKPVDKMVLYRRIKTISEVLGHPHLTTKNIVKSGMLYEAYKKIQENGTLKKDDYIAISKKFNIENWYNVKRHCNEDLVKKIYKNEKAYAVMQ